MKNTTSSMMLGLGLLSASLANAADGTIQFNGLIQDQSCNISVNGSGNGNGTVKLPSVTLDELADIGTEAGKTSIVIHLKSCTPGVMVRPFFLSNNVYAPTGALSNTTLPSSGGASNINLTISNVEGTRLDLNTNLVADNPFREINSNGSAVFVFFAKYLSIGVVGAGKVTSALVYNIVYQ